MEIGEKEAVIQCAKERVEGYIQELRVMQGDGRLAESAQLSFEAWRADLASCSALDEVEALGLQVVKKGYELHIERVVLAIERVAQKALEEGVEVGCRVEESQAYALDICERIGASSSLEEVERLGKTAVGKVFEGTKNCFGVLTATNNHLLRLRRLKEVQRACREKRLTLGVERDARVTEVYLKAKQTLEPSGSGVHLLSIGHMNAVVEAARLALDEIQ